MAKSLLPAKEESEVAEHMSDKALGVHFGLEVSLGA